VAVADKYDGLSGTDKTHWLLGCYESIGYEENHENDGCRIRGMRGEGARLVR